MESNRERVIQPPQHIQGDTKMSFEKLDMYLWIGTIVFGLITYTIRRSRLNKWEQAIDFRVTGVVPYRPLSAHNEDVFLSGVEWAFLLITFVLGVLAVGFIPN
jgi:hypothetical protein